MNKSLLYFIFALTSTGLFAAQGDDSPAVSTGPKVIFKLDDGYQKNGLVPTPWHRVYEYAQKNDLPFTMGIVCRNLRGGKPEFYETLKAWHASGLIEYWNHGYDHKMWEVDGETVYEFSGSGYEHQYQHFKDSQDLGRELLGIEFTAFGAPFNKIDEDTEKMLNEFPEIKIWLYGPRKHEVNQTVLRRSGKIYLEHKTGDIDFERFKKAYLNDDEGSPLVVLQGHPMNWDDDDFMAFQNVVDFLREQGATFVLPRDYIPKNKH
jgi:peptidoglycan/xylan/chitin deacetylase (PgdA/CDA1 family)